MNNEDIKITARHFAKAVNLTVRFKDGACPSTDGKEITLPTDLNRELLYPMLGGLLHESSHVRYSEFQDYGIIHLDNHIFDCLNVLEDIRVDYKTVQEYPQAIELYRELMFYSTNAHKQALQDEPFAQKILKHLMLMANSFPPYYPNAVKFIKKFHLNEQFVDKAKVARSTRDLIPLAKELAQLILGVIENERERIKQAQNVSQKGQSGQDQEKQDEQGQSSGSEQGEETSSNQGNSSQTPSKPDDNAILKEVLTQVENQGKDTPKPNNSNNSDDKDSKDSKEEEEKKETEPIIDDKDLENDAEKNIQREEQLTHEAIQAKVKYDQEDAEYQQQSDKSNKEEDKWRNALRRLRGNNTRERNLNREINYTADATIKSKLEKKAKRAKELAETADIEKNIAQSNCQKIRIEANKQYTKRSKAGGKVSHAQNKLEHFTDPINKTFGFSDEKVQIHGFGSFKEEDIIAKQEIDLKLDKSLDDVLREFFARKKDQRILDDEGNRIKTSRLARLFTTGTGLFTEQISLQTKTKVAFLLDASGSMSGNNAQLVIQTAGSILESLQRIVASENLPVDIGVYAFDTQVIRLKEFEKDMTAEEIVKKYRQVKLWRGTNLCDALFEVYDEMHKDGITSENIMVVITDACVEEKQLTKLRNNAPADLMTLYIGIDADIEKEEVQLLFRDYNITDKDNALEIITKALMEGLNK